MGSLWVSKALSGHPQNKNFFVIYQDILCLFRCVDIYTDGAAQSKQREQTGLVVMTSSWPHPHIKRGGKRQLRMPLAEQEKPIWIYSWTHIFAILCEEQEAFLLHTQVPRICQESTRASVVSWTGRLPAGTLFLLERMTAEQASVIQKVIQIWVTCQ